MAGIDRLFGALTDLRGSDLHLAPGRPPMARLLGEVGPLRGEEPLKVEAVKRLIEEIAPATGPDGKPGDPWGRPFVYELPGKARFRIRVFRQVRGLSAVCHLVPLRPSTLAELGLPAPVVRLARLTQGLVLVTGPDGAGKSSTLAALVEAMNGERAAHVVTIEEPIEYLHDSRRSLVTQTEVGLHGRSFCECLRAARREDADVVLVSEIPDLETLRAILDLSDGGALVLAATTASSSARAIERLVELFPDGEEDVARGRLANALRVIVAQRLIRSSDGKGRVCAAEVAVFTSGLASLVREGKCAQLAAAIHAGKAEGMLTLEQSLSDLVERKKISREAARAETNLREFSAGLLEG